MSCDFGGTKKEGEKEKREMLTRSCVTSSSTAVNHKSDALSNLCLFEANDQVSIVSSRTQARIEPRVPSWHDTTNSVGEYSFICAIILECVAFCPLYIHDHLRPRRETRVHLYRRGYYCFVDLFAFPLKLYVVLLLQQEECGEATGICKYRNFDSES